MAVNILIVDTDTQPGMELLAGLELPLVKVTFVDQTLQALKNVKRYGYDIIVLGDRLKGGTTYDVGLEISTGKKNRHVPIVCLGKHIGRVYRLVKLLGSYAIQYDERTTSKLKEYLELQTVKSQGR